MHRWLPHTMADRSLSWRWTPERGWDAGCCFGRMAFTFMENDCCFICRMVFPIGVLTGVMTNLNTAVCSGSSGGWSRDHLC